MSDAGIRAVADALLRAREHGKPADATPLVDALANADSRTNLEARINFG